MAGIVGAGKKLQGLASSELDGHTGFIFGSVEQIAAQICVYISGAHGIYREGIPPLHGSGEGIVMILAGIDDVVAGTYAVERMFEASADKNVGGAGQRNMFMRSTCTIVRAA